MIKIEFFTFNVERLPMFYTAGFFDVTIEWKHKHMYQRGNYEIILMLKGSLFLEVDNQQHVIKQDEYFIVPPFRNMNGYKPSKIGTKFIWIHFFPKVDINLTSSNVNKFYSVMVPQHAQIPNRAKVIVSAYNILNEYATNQTLTPDIAIAELLSLLGHRPNEFNDDTNKISMQVKRWINSHLDIIEKVDDITSIFNFNKTYLNRIFKKEQNISIYKYVIFCKISRAKTLLVSTADNINVVSKNAFFNDDKHFIKIFKKYTGLTPSEYRICFRSHNINSPKLDPEVTIPDRIRETKKSNQLLSKIYK